MRDHTNILQSCQLLMLVMAAALWTKEASTQHRESFIHRKGGELVVAPDDTVIFLRGVNFQNDHLVSPTGEWTRDGRDDRSQPLTDWYQESHVRSMAEMGFNVIRFMLNYRLFEDNSNPGRYKDSAWAFIDRYLDWARKYHFYLILDMHCPPGGFQSWGEGRALWDERQNQERLIALWKAIAVRYRDEPRIAGYDLLNEPMPYRPEQWKRLAQELVDAIRSVDASHLIIVEHVCWLLDGAGNWSLPLLESFQFTVSDPKGRENVMYDMHFYEPPAYALQLTPATKNRDGGKYPDPLVRDRAVDGRMLPRTSESLEYQLKLMLVNFGKKHGVPMNVGEWAPMDTTFANKGGLPYISDLLKLMDQYGLHWQYYSYNEFYTDGSLQRLKPEPAATIEEYFRR